MQDRIESKNTKLKLLNLRLAELEAERERIELEVKTLDKTLSKDTWIGQWSRTTLAAVSVLAVASLLSASGFHDAQSSMATNNQSELSAMSTLQNAHILHSDQLASNSKQPTSQPGKRKLRSANAKPVSQKRWGPLLVMPEPTSKKRYFGFDPMVKRQQESLLDLGFDLGEADGFNGPRTQQAVAEFRALYLPNSAQKLTAADLAVLMEIYANLARTDAVRYGIDQGVVAAIRLSSVRTGVDFPYLMKLAATESNFKPDSESATSSATGMYQFTRETWLNTLKKHGEKYGLVGDYATKIEYYKTRSGGRRPIVRDESLSEHLLALRKNPRLSAMMAAETVLENQQKLAHLFDREPTETDLYLTHFLGPDGAITFLRSLEQEPDKHAVELFPRAASSNRDIFHPRTCAPRTVDEVYALFGEKFSRRRYE